MADDNNTTTTASPQDATVPPQAQPLTPITLTAPGEREVVDSARASEIVSHWRTELDAHREKLLSNDPSTTNSTTDTVVLCDRIVLTDKSYTSDAATVISKFLTSNQPPPYTQPLSRTITHADLSDVIASRMEDEGLLVLKTLCDAFSGGILESVDLSDNAMGCKGVQACSAVLGGQSSTLRELSLCNNGLSEETMGEVASILTAPSSSTTTGGGGGGDRETENGDEHPTCVATNLTKLHFFNNMSGDGGCESFATILSRCTSSNLIDLRFSGTRATREGSLVIANALHSLTTGPVNHLANLRRLDLADNTFGYGGGDVLAKVLQKTPNLSYLNLRDCVLEDEATKFVCHALWSTGAPLHHLDLSANEIGPNGARALADLVEEIGGSTLRVLHVEENELSSRGVRFLARAIMEAAEDGEGADGGGCVIEDLRLNQNEFGRIGAVELVNAAPALPRLRILGVDGNMIPEDAVGELECAYGEKLGSMEDNDPDEDVDSEVESDEDDDDDDGGKVEGGGAEATGEGEGAKTEDGSADVDALTAAVGGIKIDGFC